LAAPVRRSPTQLPDAPRRKLAVNIVNTTGNAALTLQHLIRQQGYFEALGLDPTMLNVADGSKLMGVFALVPSRFNC
jgi:hypothetical protein